MKYTVTTAGQTFEVEIEDINARPVVARVGGERFEVTPENGTGPGVRAEAVSRAAPPLPRRGAQSQNLRGDELTAPLPGVVTELFVKTGDQVEAGQVVLTIEAMKMKNAIRSVRAGRIGEVLVGAGQTVAHKQALLRFADAGEATWI
ncbi:MAG TPA: acetyl-CoA carboxylase biotin carboxyl carrier protein subunit [Gemmatimonadales bacterium]|nr:acetyl-CoA carboxylase biotin carboxyl carrier protein subunit [Gemmatimonadales bacterium]